MTRDGLGRLPVIVVTGFLGSGKTTLINELLSSGEHGRVAALVNDFGAVNVDAALIAAVADTVVELTNGCVCCAINGDLYAAAKRVVELSPSADLVVVETTGLANPLPVGLTFLQTDLRERTTLESVVTVVDAASFALDLFDDDAATAQIVHGDLIVLNKADLVTDDELGSLEARIRVLKPRARTVRAVRGRVPRESLVGPSSGDWTAAGSPHDHHELSFASHSFRFEGPLLPDRFQAWLDRGVPDDVYRGKGFVRFAGVEGSFVFQLCGSRSSFDPLPRPVTVSELVFIGPELEREPLAEALAWCTDGAVVDLTV